MISCDVSQFPSLCTKSASAGDILEISYQAKLKDGTIVDGLKSMDNSGTVLTVTVTIWMDNLK